MIRKRKTKGNKLAKMNEEERARYMQSRAESELEARRRKQQLIATFTKNKLKREEVFSRLNIAKINEKWRFVLRQIKSREIYDNVKNLCESFDRVVRLKNRIICRLHDNLKIAYEDHRKLQEVHIILINDIIAKYKEKLATLRDTYKLNDIKSNNLIELNFLQNCMNKNYKEIQNNINKRNNNLSNEQSITKTQNAINIHNVLFMENNVASNLVYQSFVNMDNIWVQLNKVLTEYERMTKDKKKQYEYLREQENIHQQHVLQYPEVHLQLQNVVESLKRDIEILSFKRKEQIAKHKAKDTDIKKKIQNIKQQFTTIQVVDYSRLKKLIVLSNDVLLKLRKSMKTGSIILEIIAMCSALEPFLFNLNKYSMQDTTSSSFNKIDIFWEQYNHMTANNILLEKKCKNLCSRNERLRYKLQTYLITVSGVPAMFSLASNSI
ncbi:dynein regulatory complex subunit 2 [Colletes latitarsis]|uniref:dynein regulatory complex subunit 2 n=1 Tax=Colletes latitarsis TaxID=2605962 RepID=UPI0040362450